MEYVSVVLFVLSGCYVVMLCVKRNVKKFDNKKTTKKTKMSHDRCSPIHKQNTLLNLFF